ncbi:MAG TPA: helix-turn-helix transcriptional regulator, partial [Pseudonocardiaceae bacterium]
MPRREEPIDSPDGPLAGFAGDLRELRRRAGSPSYREMAASSPVSHTSLSRAAKGRALPTWKVVECYLSACGVSVAAMRRWRARWQALHSAVPAPGGPEQEPPPDIDLLAIRSADDLRAAVQLVRNGRTRTDLAAAMGRPESCVDFLLSWPDQVDGLTLRAYLMACGVPDDETMLTWAVAWRRARQSGPQPASDSPAARPRQVTAGADVPAPARVPPVASAL